jgi:hypothetical protein
VNTLDLPGQVKVDVTLFISPMLLVSLTKSLMASVRGLCTNLQQKQPAE